MVNEGLGSWALTPFRTKDRRTLSLSGAVQVLNRIWTPCTRCRNSKKCPLYENWKHSVSMSEEKTGKLSMDGWALEDHLQENETLNLCHSRYGSYKLKNQWNFCTPSIYAKGPPGSLLKIRTLGISIAKVRLHACALTLKFFKY